MTVYKPAAAAAFSHMQEMFPGQTIKALLLDYTGTMVKEEEPYTMELLKYFLTHSALKEPKIALQTVWGLIKKLEHDYHADTFLLKDEMVDRILDICVREHGLEGDLNHMHDLWRNSWIHAPLYEDVKPFFAACPLPIYIITNDDLQYIHESLQEKQLTPAGIISAEMVRACKPHREIFDKALEVAGVTAAEAVMIGDSMTSDIRPAAELGIHPILLDRKGLQKDLAVPVIRSLTELISQVTRGRFSMTQ